MKLLFWVCFRFVLFVGFFFLGGVLFWGFLFLFLFGFLWLLWGCFCGFFGGWGGVGWGVCFVFISFVLFNTMVQQNHKTISQT